MLCFWHSLKWFIYTGCAFVTFSTRSNASSAIRALHQSKTFEVKFTLFYTDRFQLAFNSPFRDVHRRLWSSLPKRAKTKRSNAMERSRRWCIHCALHLSALSSPVSPAPHCWTILTSICSKPNNSSWCHWRFPHSSTWHPKWPTRPMHPSFLVAINCLCSPIKYWPLLVLPASWSHQMLFHLRPFQLWHLFLIPIRHFRPLPRSAQRPPIRNRLKAPMEPIYLSTICLVRS